MGLEIDITDETSEVKMEEVDLLIGLLNHASSMENVEDGSEVSITIVSNESIQELNKKYRGKDQETDVISFPMEELGEGETVISDVPGLPRILGDIVISIDKAREQAKEYGHSVERELGFLAVHGFLHLLGYDHMTPEDEKRMFTRQGEILDSYGLQR